MPALRLQVADPVDADHFRFVLREDGGGFVADHDVALDRGNSSYRGLTDLRGHVQFYAAPDRREADEHRLVDEVGTWIGDQVLGRGIAEKLLARARPSVVVRVIVPPSAEWLLTLPLEIASIGGKRLSAAGVDFVFEMEGGTPAATLPVGARLRILAMFSLPPVGDPLNLRRERRMLSQLVDRAGRRVRPCH